MSVDLAPAICINAAQLLEQVWGVLKQHIGKPVDGFADMEQHVEELVTGLRNHREGLVLAYEAPDLREAAKAVAGLDWTLLSVMIRDEAATEGRLTALKRFFMKFSPETCLDLIRLLDSSARILYDSAEAQHFNVDDAQLVLRQMDELVGLPELA